MVKVLKSKDEAAPNLATIPTSLDAVQAVGPPEFDLLWGASFASGDPRYCSKILARFAAVANVGDNADDLVHLARNMESGQDQQWIVDKRGPDKARELVPVASALCALHSNAEHHPFVQTVMTEYITAHSTEPAAKALSALAQEYGYYQLNKVITLTEPTPGNHSVTVNILYLSQILDDLGRHASGYPAKFEFADDRPRAEKDVTTISNMLDPLTDNPGTSPLLLLRLGILHAIGFNLDIPDSFQKASTAFTKLLSRTPDDPQANYRYGSFLATTTRKGEGIPFLEKAKSLGFANAEYEARIQLCHGRRQGKSCREPGGLHQARAGRHSRDCRPGSRSQQQDRVQNDEERRDRTSCKLIPPSIHRPTIIKSSPTWSYHGRSRG